MGLLWFTDGERREKEKGEVLRDRKRGRDWFHCYSPCLENRATIVYKTASLVDFKWQRTTSTNVPVAQAAASYNSRPQILTGSKESPGTFIHINSQPYNFARVTGVHGPRQNICQGSLLQNVKSRRKFITRILDWRHKGPLLVAARHPGVTLEIRRLPPPPTAGMIIPPKRSLAKASSSVLALFFPSLSWDLLSFLGWDPLFIYLCFWVIGFEFLAFTYSAS